MLTKISRIFETLLLQDMVIRGKITVQLSMGKRASSQGKLLLQVIIPIISRTYNYALNKIFCFYWSLLYLLAFSVRSFSQ